MVSSHGGSYLNGQIMLNSRAFRANSHPVKDPVGNSRENVDGSLNLSVASGDAKVNRVRYARLPPMAIRPSNPNGLEIASLCQGSQAA
jgi:hypothetical protein